MREPAIFSRRAAAALPLVAFAGAAAAAPAALPAALQTNPDAELLDLGRRWQSSIAEMARLTEQLYDAEERAIAPPYPETIYFWQFRPPLAAAQPYAAALTLRRSSASASARVASRALIRSSCGP